MNDERYPASYPVYMANAVGNLNREYTADILAAHPRSKFIGRVVVITTNREQRALVRFGQTRHEKRFTAGRRISADALAVFVQESADMTFAPAPTF